MHVQYHIHIIEFQVDNTIQVEPHQTVRVLLGIEENELAKTFSVETEMKGRVCTIALK